MFNKIILVGRLCSNPEMRSVGESGTSKTTFRLATNRYFLDRNGNKKEETLFIDVEVWGNQAESCFRFLTKGKMVLVEGRLKLDNWEDQNGNRKQKYYVHAENVRFLSPKESASANDTEAENTDTMEDEIPF